MNDDRDLFALGGGDRCLLAIEERLRQLHDERRDMNEDALDGIWKETGYCIFVIKTTVPKTLAGCAVKLRLLADPEMGIPVGDSDDDVLCVRQTLICIEGMQSGSSAIAGEPGG